MSILSDLTLDDLMYLVAFADHGTVTDGAKQLGVSQPQFSKKMVYWREREPPLFRRKGRRDVLTPRGERIVAASRSILRQTADLQAFLRERTDGPQILTLAAGAIGSGWFLAPAIAKMKALDPQWMLRTTVLRGSDRIRAVCRGELDLAIVSHSEAEIQVAVGRAENLRIEPIATESLCAVADKKTESGRQLDKVLRGQEVSLELLSQWDLVGLDARSGVRRQLEAACRSSGCELRFTAEAGGWWAIKEFAKSGLGVGILPLAFLSREDTNRLAVRRLVASTAIEQQAITRHDDQRDIITQLRQVLVECGAEHMQAEQRRWAGIL